MTHIDVGYSRSMALILGVQPTTLVLCGAKDGKTIRDDRTAIKSSGDFPAACDCPDCQTITRLMYFYDLDPVVARRRLRKTLRDSNFKCKGVTIIGMYTEEVDDDVADALAQAYSGIVGVIRQEPT